MGDSGALFFITPPVMTTAANDKPAGKKPIVKKQLGNISVAVFERAAAKPDGTTYTAKDYVLQKS